MSVSDARAMLRYLDMLLKHGTYTKAAKSLYLSQPYLTQTIKKKEQELEIELINRQAVPLRLTEAGRLYYNHIEKVVREEDAFLKKVQHHRESNAIHIRIGVLASLGTYLIPLVLPTICKKFPSVTIELIEDYPTKNERRLLTNELDFLLGQNPETLSPQAKSYSCGKQGYYAIIPDTSPLYSSKSFVRSYTEFSLKELLSQKLLLTQSGSAIRRQVDYLIQKLPIKPSIFIESSNIFTLCKLAQAGAGVTLLPESVWLLDQAPHFNVVPLPLDLISLEYYIAHPISKQLSDVEAAIIKIFIENVKQHVETQNELPYKR